MSETNVEPTNCLDIIEQLRYDRDKYIGMWRSQCQITEQVMKERDRYKEALERIGKFGWDAYISNIVRNVLEKTPTR